ncbi:MAG TPA: hypothetical protein VFF14_00580 [Candidatus Deferrimicrobium sp.]|nr:hypothetical protein [Candidatus Deferrimicrobium sp.]
MYGGLGGFGGCGAGFASGYGVGVGGGTWGVGAIVVGTLILIALVAVFSFGGL